MLDGYYDDEGNWISPAKQVYDKLCPDDLPNEEDMLTIEKAYSTPKYEGMAEVKVKPSKGIHLASNQSKSNLPQELCEYMEKNYRKVTW